MDGSPAQGCNSQMHVCLVGTGGGSNDHGKCRHHENCWYDVFPVCVFHSTLDASFYLHSIVHINPCPTTVSCVGRRKASMVR